MFVALGWQPRDLARSQREPVDAIIFATGYRPSLGYLRGLDALDGDGAPIHDGGISATHLAWSTSASNISAHTPQTRCGASARTARAVTAPLAAWIRGAPAAVGLAAAPVPNHTRSTHSHPCQLICSSLPRQARRRRAVLRTGRVPRVERDHALRMAEVAKASVTRSAPARRRAAQACRQGVRVRARAAVRSLPADGVASLKVLRAARIVGSERQGLWRTTTSSPTRWPSCRRG